MSAMENIPSDTDNVFVGRQPIFDHRMKVCGYELLFRAGNDTVANIKNGTNATSEVIINAFLEIGMQNLTDGKQAYINLTRDYLDGTVAIPLEPADVVLEVLEDIKVDDELITSLQHLSAKGFTIALDDFVFKEDKQPLLGIADIVKIDMMSVEPEALDRNLPHLKEYGVKLLAEKIETQQDFESCLALGFDMFQGYFFSKPNVLSGKTLPSNKIAILELVARLQSPKCDFNELEKIISHDVGISYKLMRILNSAYYSTPGKVESIHQALILLGLNTIRNWVTVLALTNITNKPVALFVNSLQRAKMCMELGERTEGTRPDTCFTVGLFSALDAMMDRPIEELLARLPLSEDVIDALTHHEGVMGRLLKIVLDYEHGHWQEVEDQHIPANELRTIYFASINWASSLTSHMIDEADI
jgi:EAL and modified HD-GYP domain-containing signal transduction protein